MLEPKKNGRHQGSTSQPIVVECEDHSAIQAPLSLFILSLHSFSLFFQSLHSHLFGVLGWMLSRFLTAHNGYLYNGLSYICDLRHSMILANLPTTNQG